MRRWSLGVTVGLTTVTRALGVKEALHFTFGDLSAANYEAGPVFNAEESRVVARHGMSEFG